MSIELLQTLLHGYGLKEEEIKKVTYVVNKHAAKLYEEGVKDAFAYLNTRENTPIPEAEQLAPDLLSTPTALTAALYEETRQVAHDHEAAYLSELPLWSELSEKQQAILIESVRRTVVSRFTESKKSD